MIAKKDSPTSNNSTEHSPPKRIVIDCSLIQEVIYPKKITRVGHRHLCIAKACKTIEKSTFIDLNELYEVSLINLNLELPCSSKLRQRIHLFSKKVTSIKSYIKRMVRLQ